MIPATLKATTDFCADYVSRTFTRLSISAGYGLHRAADDLMQGIREDNSQRVRRVFSDYGVDTLVEQIEARALTPLHDAARFHYINAMGVLIDALPREMLNALDEDHSTPLIVAASNGHNDIVERLLGANASDTTQGEAGSIAPAGVFPPGFVEGMWAFFGYASVDGGPPVTAPPPVLVDAQDRNGDTALLLAMQLDFEEIVETLVRYGADVNIANQLGERPLTLALDRRNFEILQLLCEHGADTNAVDRRGMTPLLLAVESGDLQAARALLLAGANVHFKNTATGATVDTLVDAQRHPALRALLDEYQHKSSSTTS